MKSLIFASFVFFFSITNEKIRSITYEGQQVKTTFGVPSAFIGEYKGRKSGYLVLNEDGSGVYRYDIFGFAPASCKNEPIAIEWGFIVILIITSLLSLYGCKASDLPDS